MPAATVDIACQLEDPEEVWLNKAGTFGGGCASYFWARLFGIISRCAIAMLGKRRVWQLVYSDDVHWIVKGRQHIGDTIVAVFLLTLLGTPFSWHKTKGGMEYKCVGLWVNLETYELGISQKRADWLTT